MPFWCGNKRLHKRKPDRYMDEGCCLTHTVGLPLHPATKQPMPLTPYQVEFVEIILKDKKPKRGQTIEECLRQAHKYHINKGRQMGFTEIVLRLIQYLGFHDYAGYNVGIMAATNGSLALKDLRRFARLYKSIPIVVEQWVKNKTMRFANGMVVEAFPASEEAATGDTAYKAFFMDESAKWKLVDDTPVFNSIEPIIEAAGGDFLLVSTPKGPIKMFHQIHKEPRDFLKLQYDIWHSEGNLYTRKEIQRKIEMAQGDPAQEYLCKYRFGRDSVLGEVKDSERTDELEWGMTDDDFQGDEYVEPDDLGDAGDDAGGNDEEWRP